METTTKVGLPVWHVRFKNTDDRMHSFFFVVTEAGLVDRCPKGFTRYNGMELQAMKHAMLAVDPYAKVKQTDTRADE